MTSPKNINRISAARGRSSVLPLNHPIRLIEGKVGSFSHLLPTALLKDQAFWTRVLNIAGDRKLLSVVEQRHLPVFMLPVFKRMIEVPFDMMVSIPRAGDPLAYTLYKLADRAQRFGVKVLKLPAHEALGVGIGSKIALGGFLTREDLGRKVGAELKSRLVVQAKALPQEQLQYFLHGKTIESFEEALSSELERAVAWFRGTGKAFADSAVPFVVELVRETALASSSRGIKNILAVDDTINDYVAYDSVYYPISIFFPQAELQVGLLSGQEDHEKWANAICASYSNAWIVMQRGEWTGSPGEMHEGPITRKAFEMLSPRIAEEVGFADEINLRQMFSFFACVLLYKNGLIFSASSSWARAGAEKKLKEKYGDKAMNDVETFVKSEFTPAFIEKLTAQCPTLSRMASGMREIERGTEMLFGSQINQRLLRFYLKSPHGVKDLRSISNLLTLINQQ